MDQLFSTPWAAWAIGVAIGLPLVMLLLGELSNALAGRNSPFIRPVQVTRIAVAPLGAVLLLLRRGAEVSDTIPVRLLETCFTVAVVATVLLLIDATIAQLAGNGTERRRIPGIFVDLLRVILVISGIFIVLATVWTQPVEHFLTALGVTSIVIGIALQNAVGNVVSGLLLLSERPFSIGDWIQVGTLTGRVSEINWRSVHLNTGSSVQVVPNGMLATSTFANFNRPASAYSVTTALHFSIGDPPDQICGLLSQVAAEVPQALPGIPPSTELISVDAGICSYETTFEVASFESSRPARTTFLTRSWFAARRAGFTLAGMPPPAAADLVPVLRSIAPLLRLDDDELAELAPQVHIEEYASGETVQRQGEMGPGLRVILDGTARREVVQRGRGAVPLGELHRHDAFGTASLTHEPALATVRAVDKLTVLTIPSATINQLMDRKPLLANDLGQLIDRLRSQGAGTPLAARNGAAARH